MSPTFFFYANPYQPQSLDAARALFACLQRRGANVLSDPWLAGQGVGEGCNFADLPAGVAAIVCFGGDGTLLRAAPLAAEKNIPLAGVHTGRVGFLMPFAADAPDETAEKLTQSAGFRHAFPMLEAHAEGRRFLCLNDVSLTRGEHPGVIDTAVYADGELVFHPCGDGVVIATPQGSTAYALAAGGPIVTPDVPCLVAVPLSPRELLLRPTVLPLHARITVTARGSARRRLQLALDGQTLLPIEKEVSITLALAQEQTVLLYPDPPRFFHTLRQKQSAWNRQMEE